MFGSMFLPFKGPQEVNGNLKIMLAHCNGNKAKN